MTGDGRSHGLWAASAPPAPPAPPLAGDAAADVAVVGAGFTGLSAALHLAEGGARVAVLEADGVGFGASGRNVGLVNAGLWVMPDDVAAVLGDVHGPRVLDLLGAAPGVVFDLVRRHAIACEAQPRGTLHCAPDAKGLEELRERERQWQARGAPVRLLDAAETARRTGSPTYAGALLDERAGTIQPLAYARGLARAALAAGAAIHAESPVLEAVDEGAAWALRTPGGTLRAKSVIVATDAYGAHLWPQVRTEQVRLPYFNLATAPLGGNLRRTVLAGGEGAWDTREILSSFRMDAAGRLVFGSVGALRGTGGAIHRSWGRRALARLFPQLGEVAFEHEWWGWIGMTSDAVPRFHRLGRGVVSVSGYNGRGIAPGTVFGRALAQLVLGALREEDMPLPLTDARAAAARPLREAYYEAGAQLAHLAADRF